VIRRYELSDVEWQTLQGFLPSAVTGGRPRADDRRMLNGIVWKIRSGAPWRDVPARYGSWQSIYTRFRRWALDGTFARMLAGAQAAANPAGDIDWLIWVNATIGRAHQHTACARKGGPEGSDRTHTNHEIAPSDDPVAG
jgi:transposase